MAESQVKLTKVRIKNKQEGENPPTRDYKLIIDLEESVRADKVIGVDGQGNPVIIEEALALATDDEIISQLRRINNG